MTATTGTLLEELAREVLALRAELADLREQLATEIRTRRLVVEHESGFESIVAEATVDTARVKVAARTDDGTFVLLHVHDEPHNSTFGGLYLSGGGNGVGMFEVHQRGDDVYSASLNVDEDDGRVTLGVDGLAFKGS